MADVYDRKTRSYAMSRVRGSDTTPEQIVRKYLFSQGFRYRKNDKRYPGHPDIVLPKYKTIIFIHGCFWHQHPGCKKATIPSSNVAYWKEKLTKNVERDKKEQDQLRSMGWKVLIVWECQLNKKVREETLNKLVDNIRA